jgi:hypothetical protein
MKEWNCFLIWIVRRKTTYIRNRNSRPLSRDLDIRTLEHKEGLKYQPRLSLAVISYLVLTLNVREYCEGSHDTVSLPGRKNKDTLASFQHESLSPTRSKKMCQHFVVFDTGFLIHFVITTNFVYFHPFWFCSTFHMWPVMRWSLDILIS